MVMRYAWAMVLACGLAGMLPPALGQGNDEAFDGAIMAEPLEEAPFRAVRVPAWLEGATAYVYGSAQDAVDCGAQMAPLGIGGCETAYFPNPFLPREPSLPEDWLTVEAKRFSDLGVRLIAAIPPRLQARMYAEHPDWRSKGSRDQVLPEVSPSAPLGGPLCLLGPWGDTLIEVLADALARYPEISGFSFDGLHTSGVCYCDTCREAYRAFSGQDIPDVNMDDPAFRHYQHWLDRRLERYVTRMQERLKAVDPECALVTWSTNAGRYGHFLDIPRNMPARLNLLFDSPGQEFWMDESNRGGTVVPAFGSAYLWAVSNHRHAHSEPYIMSHGNPYGTDSFPEQEMLRRVLLTITHGPQAALSRGWRNLHEATPRVLHEVGRRAPWLTRKQPERWAALLMSDDTRVFYGRSGLVEERYLANVLGAFRATLEEHLPTTVINDWNLNDADLAGYRVLVLPNAACLSEEQAGAIRRFVEGGGGLVASVDASLFDQMGESRGDFLLADLFGAHYRGLATGSGGAEALDVNFLKAIGPDYWAKHKGIFDIGLTQHEMWAEPRLREYLGDLAVTFKGQAVRVAPDDGASVIATFAGREPGSENLPAVIAREHGAGRVVYFATGLDSAYYLYPYPYQRIMLASAVRWAAGSPPPVRVEAPMCVHATAFRQVHGGQRLVVHLYSDLNSTADHAKPEDDVPLREEVVPIHDIRVTFEGYNVRRVHLEPEGLDLTPAMGPGGLTVTVPRLDLHSMVVAELG